MTRLLTLDEAAALLRVPREYLHRLLDERRIPSTNTGEDRRVRDDDVLAFKDQRDADRRTGLRELTWLTQELGGYDAELNKKQ